jgi:predicted ArsR family transcriptional regulator
METGLHHALADPRRGRIVEELRGRRGGLDTEQLAQALELHPNTVRWHLGILRDAGIVESHPEPRSGPGRPRILYRLTPGGTANERDEYRLLATILSGAVSGRADGPSRAEESGREWGRYLVRRPAPGARVNEREAVGEVVRLLDEQGFDPDAEGTHVRMHRCPFHDLAEQHPEVVCAVHRGLISGALDELGSELDVEGLDVFVEPDLCVARLGSRTS